MCGIVGLFLKDPVLRPRLGDLLSDMLITMSDRGPDSAGIAVYSDAEPGCAKVTVQTNQPDIRFPSLKQSLDRAADAPVSMQIRDTHAVMVAPRDTMVEVRATIASDHPGIRVMSNGRHVEIYKEIGLPADVVDRFDVRSMYGTHGIGHTRMATESAVTTFGAHPFSTAEDQCLVHNGSLSNHNNLRRRLIREGMTFETENDTEVGAAYLARKMQDGASLGEALEMGISDLDGFYTFVVGTRDGFGVLRDPIACKPAVLAETERYVAFGSEYRALAGLPDIEEASVWEPEPATVYFWEHQA